LSIGPLSIIQPLKNLGQKKIRKHNLEWPADSTQDCEFGRVLLLVHEWIGIEFLEGFRQKPEKQFDWVIPTLVDSTIAAMLKPV